MSPIHFLRDYVRDDDVQFFGELGLSQDKSDILLSIIVSKLMLKTFATNIFMHEWLGGLPYVPFRGPLLAVDNMLIMINEAGHFNAEYATNPLATEDIAKMNLCPTGEGLIWLYRAGGQAPSIAANVTVMTDLWRTAASTRAMHTGPDGVERSYRTATPFRRSMEAGRREEPNAELHKLARSEHATRLLFFLGLGATMERVRKYGAPSAATPSGATSRPRPSSKSARGARGSRRGEGPVGAALRRAGQRLAASTFRTSMSAAIYEVHKQVYLLDADKGLTKEMLRNMDHSMKLSMHRNAAAKRDHARAMLAANLNVLVLRLCECRGRLQSAELSKRS